jgi:endo-1,4-beta-xylanase
MRGFPKVIVLLSLMAITLFALRLLVVHVHAADSVPTNFDSDGLRKLADAKHVSFGTAFAWRNGFDRTTYDQQASANFNSLTPEAGLYFRPLQPKRGVWDFATADSIVQFAQEHRMTARGQHLIWHHRFQKTEGLLPDWLISEQFTRSEVSAIMKDFIQTTMTHFKTKYPGVIKSWCVVNEAASGTDPATFTPSFWFDHLGASFVDDAFRWAHEADPEAILYYNDWGAEGMNAKSDFIYSMAKGLKSRGIPINGVGLQCHFSLTDYPGKAAIQQNIDRLAAAGLEIYITELDVKIEGDVTDGKLQQQAGIYRDMIDLCLDNAACKSFTLWGFNDAQSWLDEANSPTIMNRDYSPKPAFYELKRALAR